MGSTLHIDGSRVFTDFTLPTEGSVGAWADELAAQHGIAGTEFSVKVDGHVLDRAARATAADGEIIELIEVTVPTDLVPAVEESSAAPGELVPPDDTVDGVLAWVGEGRQGWRQRAQAALDTEHAKGDDARVTLVESLERSLANG